MNAFLTEALFPTVLNMSLTASAVILVVLLARFLLRRAPKVFSYALWAVVLFRLLCPVSLTAGISLFGAVDAPVRAATPGISTVEYLPAVRENLPIGAEETPATPVAPVMPVTDPEPVTPAVSSSQGEPTSAAKPVLPSLSEVAAWVWLAGVVGMLGCSLISLCRLRRRVVERGAQHPAQLHEPLGGRLGLAGRGRAWASPLGIRRARAVGGPDALHGRLGAADSAGGLGDPELGEHRDDRLALGVGELSDSPHRGTPLHRGAG